MLSALLAAASGSVVGLLLGLLGAGGSILAVPLLLYVVGVQDPHIAIGTSAVAVALSALVNLGLHAREGNVKWPCAAVLAASGVAGAIAGARLAQAVDGRKLLLAFACAMAGVAVSMFRRRQGEGDPTVHLTPVLASRLVPVGLGVGLASGFFGIGGGFLIVPGLVAATGMTFMNAIGSSLLAVAAFAAATAVSYAAAGLVAWPVAAFFVVGGAAGGLAGRAAGRFLAGRRALIQRLFAFVIIATAVYVAAKALGV